MPSTFPLGSKLPAAKLPDTVSGAIVDITAAAHGKPALVMFICNHCPYVVHVREELVRVAHEALDRGFAVLAINSNSVQTHPQDGPTHMAKLARSEGWRFPFLFDESQDVARAFSAACTPDPYVFDAAGKLVYRGQFDDARPGNGRPVTGRDLRAAIEAVAAGREPSKEQRPSVGCGIKWKR
jgi:thiol-disulfide isomerase/thioredoxin